MTDRYLFLRGGRWYARVAVPLDVRALLSPTAAGKPPHAVVRALGTADKREAVNRLPATVAAIKASFNRAREQRPLSDDEIDRLAAQRMAATFERHRRAAFRDPDAFRESVSLLAEAREHGTGAEQDDEREAVRLIRESGASENPESVARLAEALGRAEMRALAALCEDRELPAAPPELNVGRPSRTGGSASGRTGNGSLTFAGAVEAYLAAAERDAIRPKGLYQRRRTYARFAETVGDTLISDVTQEHARAFLDSMPSNATANRVRSEMNALFKHALPSGPNPFDGLRRKPAPLSRVTWLPFTNEELRSLFAGGDLSDPLYRAMLLGLFSGMRLSEILTAKVQAEGGVTFFDVREAKSDAGVRRVPVHEELERWGVFEVGGRLSASVLSKRFTRLRAARGVVGERKVFHSLRKNFVTALHRADASQDDVALLVGHARGFTFSTYAPHGSELRRLAAVVNSVRYDGLTFGGLG